MADRIENLSWFDPDGHPAQPPAGGIAEAVAAGLVGVGGSFSLGWRIEAPRHVPVTLQAVEALQRVTRAEGKGVPSEASATLRALRQRAWDTEIDVTPEDAARRLSARIDRNRRIVALAEFAASNPRSPNFDGIARILMDLPTRVQPLYEAAHRWRSGAPPWESGRDARDAGDLAAGTAATVAILRDAVRDVRGRMLDLRAALNGIEAVERAELAPTQTFMPGEATAAALDRLAQVNEDLVDAAVDRRKGRPEPPDPARSSAAHRIGLVEIHLSDITRNLDAFEVARDRLDPGDMAGLRSLANYRLAHECGRLSLELRHCFRTVLPHYFGALRLAHEGTGEAPAP